MRQIRDQNYRGLWATVRDCGGLYVMVEAAAELRELQVTEGDCGGLREAKGGLQGDYISKKVACVR